MEIWTTHAKDALFKGHRHELVGKGGGEGGEGILPL